MNDYVFVSALDLHPGLKQALKPRLTLLRIEMEIIQRLRRLQGKDDHEIREVGVREDATVYEVEERLLRQRINRMRPEHQWSEIAQSLGIDRSTLRRKRNRYDIG